VTRKIAILGATGSVGTSTLDLVERHRDRFEVVAVTAATNAEGLANIVRRTGAKLAVIADRSRLKHLQDFLADADCRVAAGDEALVEAASGEADVVVGAIVGCAGLKPVMAAVEAGKTVALANKEALVTAGEIMTRAAQAGGATLLPVDSEHNAIFQCLAGSRSEDVSKIILTASGGPFRTATADFIAQATPAQAVAHPNWSMGAKISVDSATLMNKGLELIEAHYLFAAPSEQLEVVIHPQSVVHSMVELCDGSVIAQLGVTDMRLPIQYAFSYPDRWAAPMPPLDLIRCGPLEFEVPDTTRFPCLRLAFRALEGDPGLAIVLNAANEVAVAAFLDGTLPFNGIPEVIGCAMDAHDLNGTSRIRDLDDVRVIDEWARTFAARSMSGLQ